jgi:plasmid stabilization system protein ParE
MTFGLVIEPEVKDEIREIAIWYDWESEARRDSFLSSLDTVLERLQQNPYQYQVIYGEVRRALLARFPYSVIYVVRGNEVVVAACLHDRRDPKQWQKRLPR